MTSLLFSEQDVDHLSPQLRW